MQMSIDRAVEIVDNIQHAKVEFDNDAALIRVQGTFTIEELEAIFLTSKAGIEYTV